MSFVASRLAAFSTAIILLAATGSSAIAQKKYDTGATDTEIKIGNIMPYSGPASAWSVIGRTEAAYFRKINAEGGINGRKINFISFNIMNYAFGLTGIRLRDYVLASFFCMAPGALAYTYLGYAGREAAAGQAGAIRKAVLA